MIRRPLRTASRLVVLAAISLVAASCSAVPPTGDAFRVNGMGYPEEKFSVFLEALSGGGQFQVTNGKVNSETYTSILRTLVRYESYRQWASDLGLAESAQDRAAAEARAATTQNWDTYPEPIKEVIINLNAAERVISRAAVPAEDVLRRMYETAPASSGALCASHIIVNSRAEAEAVMARLDAGEKFADLARKVSIEPAAEESGGSLGISPDNPCQRLQDFQAGLDLDFVTAVVKARAGVPTGPIQSSFGWHVVLNRPFDEIGDALRSTIADSAGNSLLSGWMTGAEIEIDPKFGTWNTARSAIE
ncbi:MAG: peptidylprolyl isomerase [Actinomycetota bacterium]